MARPLKMAALSFSVPPCLTSACFTYTFLTRLTFLHTCPRPQLVIVLIKEVERGMPALLVPVVTDEPT